MGELVTFGVEKLWELLSNEYALFQGAGDQVTELKDELQVLKSFLKDADAKKHTSAMVKTYVEQIKEIIYDAEDIIETFVLKTKMGGTSGIKNRVRRLACIIPDRKEIALEIQSITTRISTVIGDMKKLGVAQTVSNGGGSTAQPLHDRQREMRQTFSNESESNLVGLEENIKKLVELIVEEENIQVVTITGMGGVGKTTLARQVFTHEKVKKHFDGLVWVCVSQEFTREQVWQTILQSFRSKDDREKISKMAVPELQGELYQLLETSKSLVVLDDIWKEEDWDLIKKIFPAEKGSKVLLTSRNKRVAGPSNTRHINFQSECLSEENSWILLQKIAFPKRDESELKAGEEMENMAKQMIKHCSGLPLAIKVLGGLLAEKYTVYDWERISKGIRSRILTEDNNNGSVSHILSLSFEELPQYLKECFLYLAHFPEDYVISVGSLSYYLGAEEIIPKSRYYNEDTIRDVGYNYIEQLVRRNMVISKTKESSSRFKTCQLHDMMREICLSKAKEENFLRIVGINSPSPNSQSHSTSRRLVSHDVTTFVQTDLNNPKLRCLLLFVCYNDHWMFPCSSFTRLQLLRVLNIRSAKFKGGKLPSSIGKLIHLRYLSLYDAEVSHLPSSLRNLKLLIYLDIRIPGEGIFVPNILMEMRELRYLALPWYMHKKTKLELSNLVKLETLENFSTRSSNIKDLHGMSGLRSLTIIVYDDDEISKQTLSASIGGLKHLEYLRIYDIESDSMKEDGRFVLDCILLRHLELDIHIPRVQLHLPTHLTFIAMTRCKFEEDPMPILEKLPHLEVVILANRSFCGRRMVCSGGGFPKLQDLALLDLHNLEEWVVEEGSMPLLHTLYIHQCWKLKELPSGVRFIKSLKDLNVSEKWEERLKEGGEDYYKVQHIPSVKFDWRNTVQMEDRFQGEWISGYFTFSVEPNPP